MPCDVDPDEGPAVEPDDDEHIEHGEVEGRDDKQIHRGDMRGMIMQKSAPPLARRHPSPDHVFGDAGLRNLKSEFEQFPVDAGRAPQRVLDAHLPDQRTQFRLYLRPLPLAPLISNANNDESRPDASAPASQDV